MVYIAVADVDGLVKQGTAIDQFAAHNTTSVYTPMRVFPMLPLKLSTDLTSLNEAEDRCVVVVQMEIDNAGQFALIDIYLAAVRNKAKLTYNNVFDWLEGKEPLSHSLPDLENQLRLQEETARHIQSYRDQQGALNFSTNEIQPAIVGNTVKLEPDIYNRAKGLISNMMIVANVGVTQFLTKHQLPTLRRVVRSPKQWGDIVALAKKNGENLPAEPDVKALPRISY